MVTDNCEKQGSFLRMTFPCWGKMALDPGLRHAVERLPNCQVSKGDMPPRHVLNVSHVETANVLKLTDVKPVVPLGLTESWRPKIVLLKQAAR